MNKSGTKRARDGDCDDLVRGSKQQATRDKLQAFAQQFHPAPCKRPRVKSGSRNMICNDPSQPLATLFLDLPRDMQPQAQQDEQQARKTTVWARTGDPVCATQASAHLLTAQLRLPVRASEQSPSPCCSHVQSAIRQCPR